MREQRDTDVHQIYREIFEETNEVFNYEKLRTKIEQIKEKEKSKMDMLALFVKSQLENLENTTGYIQNNIQNIDKLQNQMVLLKTLSKRNRPTVQVNNDKLNQLLQVKKNISLVINRLGDFLNISDKLAEMEMLIADDSNFQKIQLKLEGLLNLETMMLESGGKKEDLAQFTQKFEEVHLFRDRFFAKVNSVFDRYLVAAKKTPEVLKNAIDIVEMNDKSSKSDIYTKMMMEHLSDAVFNRFEEILGGKSEIQLVIENMNFCVQDLLDIYEFVVPLFPESYDIFHFFEEKYKEQIQTRILPFVTNYEILKESPGLLVYLLNWLGSYEKLLTKVGFTMVDFNNLREVIKKMMPVFIENTTKSLRMSLEKIAADKEKIYTPDFEFDFKKQEMAQDIATILNQQIYAVVTQVKGELLCNLFQKWMEVIGTFVKDFVE
jgi:hypothetical protein